MSDSQRLAKIRAAVEEIVIVAGELAGVVLLSNKASTEYSDKHKCFVYQHDYFSPLGEALVALWNMTDETVSDER